MFTIANLSDSGISIILGSYNRINFLKLTIQTVRSELDKTDIPYEIIVVDGGSTDGTVPWLIKQKDTITIIQHNRGIWNNKPLIRKNWGYFMNLGFRSAKGKYVCMLSDDCLVIPGAIRNGYALFEEKLKNKETVGAIAFYWREWPVFNEYMVHDFFGILNVNHGLYLKSALEEIDYIDEETFKFYAGDVDITYKLNSKGYSIIASENSYIEHFSHTNIKTRRENVSMQDEDTNSFLKKWASLPHLSGKTWAEGYTSIFKQYEDPEKTVHLYYPYVRFYRIGLVVVQYREMLKDRLGEARSLKLGLNKISGMSDGSASLWSKMLEKLF